MRGVIVQQNFDVRLIRQLFLSKMQSDLVSLQNSAVDKLDVSDNRILEIIRTLSSEDYADKTNPHTTQNDVTDFCHTLTYY